MNKTILAAAMASAMLFASVSAMAQVKYEKPAPVQKAVVDEQAAKRELVYKIVKEWGPYVHEIHREDIRAWADRMVPTFRQADLPKLRAAAAANTFEAMIMGLTGQKAANAADLPGGIAPKALGSTSSDLVYTSLASCVLVDTRSVGGIFAAGATRNFKASGANFSGQGGSNTNCGIPNTPVSLVLSVSAISPTGNGYFRLWPFSTTKPAASNISYRTGQNIQNDITLKVSQGLTNDFSVESSSGSHLVINVLGYFAAPTPTQVECVDVIGTSVNNAPGDGYVQASVNCPTTGSPFFLETHEAVSGGCFLLGGADLNLTDSFRKTGVGGALGGQTSGWTCETYNGGSAAADFKARATCCRVPGR